MATQLIQAAQQALDAFDAFGEDDDFASLFALSQKMEALRTALQSAQASEPVARVELMQTGGNTGLATRIVEIDDPLRERLHPGDVLYTLPAPGVPEFSRIAKRKLDELQEQGFAITGYAIQRADVRGFIDGGGFVGWWQGEPDPGVPDDVVRDAERYRWLRDHGTVGFSSGPAWQVCVSFNSFDASAQTLDANIDAAIAASQAQKGGA